MFKAEGPLKSLIDNFDDFFQLNETLEFVDNITKQFKIKFSDPDVPATSDIVTIDAAQAVRQFGDYPNLQDQYNNDSDTYYAPKDSWVYVYFYNDDITNDIAVDGPILVEGNALDYDDSIFTDFDDSIFTIETL